MQAVIVAGGRGTRLAPYTMVFPKPMLPVGGQPIIETIVRQLAYYGFTDIIISLGYLGGLIKLYFEDKSKVPDGVEIRYCFEDIPLGTAGAIGLIENLEDDFLVINGDILTTLDYRKFIEFHTSEESNLTIAVGKKEVTLSLGILDIDKDNNVLGIHEKPTYTYNDNMGIYIYNRKTLDYIERNKHLDLNVLVENMIAGNERVLAYKSDDSFYWIDIGKHADFEKANIEFESRKDEFLKA